MSGSWSSISGATACTISAEGYFSTIGGNSASSAATQQTACSAGYYSASASSACTQAKAGNTTLHLCFSTRIFNLYQLFTAITHTILKQARMSPRAMQRKPSTFPLVTITNIPARRHVACTNPLPANTRLLAVRQPPTAPSASTRPLLAPARAHQLLRARMSVLLVLLRT